MQTNKLMLAIETSCDETAAAVIKNGRVELSNIISSQIALHQKYGGVVPEIASRKHVETIGYVVRDAMEQAGVKTEELDGVAVTCGPGLVGALLVGLSYGKALSYAIKKPLYGVHHIEGHISANYIGNDFEPPFICLVASGGHTHIVYVGDYGTYEVLGRTRDDAAGEAYDKVARAIGVGYPGGPLIDKLARTGDPKAIDFPRTSFAERPYDFSFSGLKSAVLNYLNKRRMSGEEICREDVAASFQQAVVDVLVDKTVKACLDRGITSVAMAGGVSANTALRGAMAESCRKHGLTLQMPAPVYCTDNAAMIGAAGYYRMMSGCVSDLSLNAVPDLELF